MAGRQAGSKSLNRGKFVAGIGRSIIIAVSVTVIFSAAGCGDGAETAAPPPLMEMVWIRPGTFTMGSPVTEKGRNNGEGPQRQVTLSGFYMGSRQVTQEQYRAVTGTNPSFFSSGPEPGEIQARRPVEQVSWYDAIVFANMLSIKEGLSPAYSIGGSANPADWGAAPESSDPGWDAVEIIPDSSGYRLPTEAQWEYACRAGAEEAFSNRTNDWTDRAAVDPLGWFTFNSGCVTHEAGRKAANAWGLYDMHGNVWEWCWDWYGIYPDEAQTDPAGASSGFSRVLRGGCASYSAQSARSAFRNYAYPSKRLSLGFRLVRPGLTAMSAF